MWAWALYDFANTIFSISILTVYFPLWIGELSGSEGVIVNAAAAFSALLVLLSAPVLGAIADFRQRRLGYMVSFTLVSVALTAALGFAGGAGYGGILVGVALFVAADLAYQSALVFYNALLPGVAAGRGTGKVSGYGTALGYVGAIFALVVLGLFVSQAEMVRGFLGPFGAFMDPGGSNTNVFVPTALLYLVFSLPAFFFVPDVAVREPRPISVSGAYRDVLSTVRNIRRYAGMGAFMLSTLLYTDAANTAVANMALYGRNVFGMETSQVTALLLFSTIFAVVGSFVFGYASDRTGPKTALAAVLALWCAAILLAAGAVGAWMLYLAGPVVGVALGGTWTVSRPMLVALAPPEKLGEFFGLFTFAGKVSAVIGPAITAGLLLVLGDLGGTAYRISIGSLAVIMAAAILLLARVPDARPPVGEDAREPGLRERETIER